MMNKIRAKVVEDCLTTLEYDVHETKEMIKWYKESIQPNYHFVTIQLSTLLKLKKGKEIDAEKASVYYNDDEGFDDNNDLERHTPAITSDKIAASTWELQ